MRQARWWLAVAVAVVGVAAVGSVAARAQEGERPAARPSAEAVRPTGGDEILSVLKRIEGRLADLEKEVFRLREENARLRWELGGRGGAPPRGEGERPLAEGDRPRAEGDRPRAEGDRPRAEGDRPRAEGDRPRAEGDRPRAEGDRPRAEGEGVRPLPRGEGDRPRGEGEVARERRPDGEAAKPRAEGEGARPLPRGEGDRPKARGEGGREGPAGAALPPGVVGFRGVLVGTVAGLSDLNFTLRVSRVEKVYEQNKADNPQNLVGKTVPIGIGRGTRLAEQHVQALKELKVGDRVQVEAFHLVGDSLTVMEELRKVAAEPGPEAR